MSDRLFPALSADAAHVASGNTDIVRNGVLIAPDGGGPQFLGPLVLFGLHSAEGLMAWDQATGVSRVKGAAGIGGNEIATAVNGSTYAVARLDPPRIIFSDNQTLAGFTSPAFSDDGRHFACLRHDDGMLFLRTDGGALMPVLVGGNPVTGCSLPRFGGTTLMCEIGNGRVLGIADCNNPATVRDPDIFDFENIPLLKPHPVWVEGLGALVYSCHTTDALILLLWGSRFGWIITRGELDQGFHDARPQADGQVRLVWSRRGVLGDAAQALVEPIDVIDALTGPAPVPDVPFLIAPQGQPFDVTARLRGSCTAEHGGVLWYRKGDPLGDDQCGAWLDYDGTNVGLLADSSTGRVTTAGGINSMYFAGTRLWMPLKGRSGWTASYDCDFVWRDGARTHEHITVAVHAGHGVYNGAEVTLRHTYDPRHIDPTNPRRRAGYLEFSYYDNEREVRWEEWQDDENGVPRLVRVTQPVPSTGPEAFVAPPRPAPYGPIVAAPTPQPDPKPTPQPEKPVVLPRVPQDITERSLSRLRTFCHDYVAPDGSKPYLADASAADPGQMADGLFYFLFETWAPLMVAPPDPGSAQGWLSRADAADNALERYMRERVGDRPQ